MKRLILLFVGMVVLMAIAPVLADDQGGTAGRSIREFVTPDGRFDLEAARQSGYQGPLDMRGFKSAIDPVTGQPLFRPSGTQEAASDPDDIYWDNNISPSVAGVGEIVYAATVYDGRLIVGGDFQAAGDVIAGYIAAWDGTLWSPLGLGTDSLVYALTVYDGKLIAGGSFTMAGGVAASKIAAWDGSSWSALGSGMGGVYSFYVNALTAYDGKLTAGGTFTVAGNKVSAYLAQWTKTSYMCGDANDDGTINLGDAVYIVNYIFKGGAAPVPPGAGDANCDATINLGDAVYIVNFIFKGGDAPCCP